jgi:amino acid adenylation domain-containing protein
MNSTEGFRLSPQQASLWSLDRVVQSYRAVCEIAIQGDLQPRVLAQAVEQLVERHEILRTTFQRPPGIKAPFQVVADQARPFWQSVDLSQLSDAEQQGELETFRVEEQTRPFDFAQPPLLRVSLFKLTEQKSVLTVSLPVLCADAQTFVNFAAELCGAYEAVLGGPSLVGEPMQYADFAEWQNELLEGEDDPAMQGRAYWQAVLSGTTGATLFPRERRTNVAATTRLGAAPIAIDRPLLDRLQGLAREQHLSLATFLLAAWQALVWRFTGAPDFLMLDYCDGRKLEDLKNAFGLYAEYLPLRCQGQDVSFLNLCSDIQAKQKSARESQEYFDSSDLAGVNTDLGFAYAEQPPEFSNASLSFAIRRQSVCLRPFKLKLCCTNRDGALSAQLEYNTEIFDREAVEKIAGYYQRFLIGVTYDGAGALQLPIGAVDILTVDERRRLLFELNETVTAFPEPQCIHELFEAQAAHTPDAIALIAGDQQLSYGELNARANQLAHLLRQHSAGANNCVGLCLERGAEMIIGLLGILKAGGAYVPLNPEHPPARLATQLVDSAAVLLITAGWPADKSIPFAGERIDLNLQRALLTSMPHSNLSPVANPDNLVYVIYTSGSTGIPKGVGVTHRNLFNYTQFILRRLEIDSPLQFATVSTITADLGNTVIFPALVSGGCLHLLSYEVAMSGELMSDYVARRPVDILKIVPSHLQALLAAQPDGKFLPHKYLVLGGETLSWDLVERIANLHRGCRVINHYGPTETTVGSLTFSVNDDSRAGESLTVPIGRPIANTRVFVLDQYLQPQPEGVAGELYLGGAGVAAGYLNQAQETAARFVADPFARAKGERLYRTGDLVRYLADGNIEFLGRVDSQVKVRGFRVELGEIEITLASHRAVRQVVVAARRDSSTARLVAYVISDAATAPNPDELREFLQTKLPDYMVPSVFVFLKTFPLTANGKIDRAGLPAPEDIRPDLQKTFVAPRTAVEKELADIWAGLLKLNAVGVHDNFFELGGHSLLATQVVSRMRQVFQQDIPLRSLFESPTVAGLAEKLERATVDDTARLLAELEGLSDEEAERLLSAERVTGE